MLTQTQPDLVNLILQYGEFEPLEVGPQKKIVQKAVHPIQLWYSPQLGFQIASAHIASFGPVPPMQNNGHPILHVDLIGEIEENVGTVIMAHQRLSIYGITRGSGSLTVEIRPYHTDFVRRIEKVDFLTPEVSGGGYSRVSMEFGIGRLSP
ncbi:MAG: hypothetical protein ACOC3C_07785, partial [Candidatus Thorarchaeota archaeon]